jgi:hypothetical protein
MMIHLVDYLEPVYVASLLLLPFLPVFVYCALSLCIEKGLMAGG